MPIAPAAVLVSVLDGGYKLAGLGSTPAAHVEALLG